MLNTNPGLKFMQQQRKIIQDYFQNYHELQEQERQEMLRLYKMAEEKRQVELKQVTTQELHSKS